MVYTPKMYGSLRFYSDARLSRGYLCLSDIFPFIIFVMKLCRANMEGCNAKAIIAARV